MQDLESKILGAKIYLNNHSPFFSTLINNTKITLIEQDKENNITTAATNGKEILLNREFISTMDDLEFCGLLSHEVLHMALSHVFRYKSLPKPKDKSPEYYMFLANYAADIIVNGIITKCKDFLSLPQGGITNPKLENLSFPEVYAELLKDPPIDYQEINICFNGNSGETEMEEGDENENPSPSESEKDKEMEEFMKELLEQAKSAEELYGNTTDSLYKHIKGMDFDDHTDYKSILSRFIISAKNAWGGYDRRFIYKGLYMDDTQNDELNINLFIDSSGSVDQKKLGQFISCVEDYLSLSNWADIKKRCFFFDMKLYGPFDSFSLDNIQGFGGTSFFPIIDKIEEIKANDFNVGNSMVNLIYTDGYSEIPVCDDHSISNTTIWILDGSGIREFLNRGWKHVFQLLD